jgi:hypothetical protein
VECNHLQSSRLSVLANRWRAHLNGSHCDVMMDELSCVMWVLFGLTEHKVVVWYRGGREKGREKWRGGG